MWWNHLREFSERSSDSGRRGYVHGRKCQALSGAYFRDMAWIFGMRSPVSIMPSPMEGMTPGPSFGPWARRPGCPAGKFHPRPWPCLILLLGSRRIAVRARVLQSGGIHWDVIVGNPDPPDSERAESNGSSFKMRMSRLGWIYYARRPVFLMLASVLQPLAACAGGREGAAAKLQPGISATGAATISITSAISQQPRLRY